MPPEHGVVMSSAAVAGGGNPDQSLHEHEVDGRDRGSLLRTGARSPAARLAGGSRSGQREGGDQAHVQRPREQEDADGPEVAPVLRVQLAAAARARPAPAPDRGPPSAGSQTAASRAARPYPFADLAVERDHRLGRDQAVVADPPAHRVERCCSRRSCPSRCTRGDAERLRGQTSAFMMCRPSAIIVPLPMIRVISTGSRARRWCRSLTALHDLAQVVPQPAQVVDDVGAVPEQAGEDFTPVIRVMAGGSGRGTRTADRPCSA